MGVDGFVLLHLIHPRLLFSQPENARKNRYVNALPYDHARVVLNALSNVNGSDYINASTMVRSIDNLLNF